MAYKLFSISDSTKKVRLLALTNFYAVPVDSGFALFITIIEISKVIV